MRSTYLKYENSFLVCNLDDSNFSPLDLSSIGNYNIPLAIKPNNEVRIWRFDRKLVDDCRECSIDGSLLSPWQNPNVRWEHKRFKTAILLHRYNAFAKRWKGSLQKGLISHVIGEKEHGWRVPIKLK